MTILLLLLLGVATYFFVLSPSLARVRTWGTTPEERTIQLPGTEHLNNPRITCTHAISIAAPPSMVWKYLVQIGQNKAGFYSYRWLENLVGCKMPDIQKIVPEFQKLQVGDKVFLHPKAPPLSVTVLIPERVLALEGWYLAIKQVGNGQSRLIARGYDWRDPARDAGLIDWIFSGVLFDIAHFIMERKMLMNIKAMAEDQILTEERN